MGADQPGASRPVSIRLEGRPLQPSAARQPGSIGGDPACSPVGWERARSGLE